MGEIAWWAREGKQDTWSLPSPPSLTPQVPSPACLGLILLICKMGVSLPAGRAGRECQALHTVVWEGGCEHMSSWRGSVHAICTHTPGGRGLPGTHTVLPQPRAPGTWPGAHSVPSRGGPFLVLQKYGLSGWLHHSCLQGSKVWNCTGRGERSRTQAPSCPGGKGQWRREGRAVVGAGARTRGGTQAGPRPQTGPHFNGLQGPPYSLRRGTEKGQATAHTPLVASQASLPASEEATVPLGRD